jgi:hypothetical protein
MICLDCTLKYTGQTGRTFNIRYKEHIQAIRNNNDNSTYSNHTLSTGHTYRTITDTMDFIRLGRKGNHSNTLEKYVACPQSKFPARPTASKPFTARSDCAYVIEQCCSMAHALTVLPAFSQ